MTLITPKRTYDLVIENEKNLFSLLNYFQHHVTFIQNRKILENARRRQKEYKLLEVLPMSKKHSLNHLEYFRFMRVKMKISYEALLRGQTVAEHIIVINRNFYLKLELNLRNIQS